MPFVLIIFFAILINPIPFPIATNRWTTAYYRYVEALPSGSLVLLSPDFVAAGYTENGYTGEAMLKQLWRKGADVIIVGYQAESPMMADKMLLRLNDWIKAHNLVYGMDYVSLPMVTGLEVGAAALAQKGKDLFSVDVYGTPISQIPIMQRFTNYASINLCIGMGGRATTGYYISHWFIPYGVRVGDAGATLGLGGSIATFDKGQIVGAVVGLTGTAEYESLIGEFSVATKLVGTLNAAVLTMVGSVIIININFVLKKFGRKT